MSLPVGNWSWRERWVCPGDETLKPQDQHSNAGTRAFAATTSAPGEKTAAGPDFSASGKPSRFQPVEDAPSSLYNEDFRGPQGWAPSTQLQQTQRYISRPVQATSRGRSTATLGSRTVAVSVPEEDSDTRGKRVWGRVNPSFYPLPLTTETGGNYVSHQDKVEPLDRTHHLKSCTLMPNVAKKP